MIFLQMVFVIVVKKEQIFVKHYHNPKNLKPNKKRERRENQGLVDLQKNQLFNH
jgi:hypothetical protein